nr:NADPH-dependent FMN reductase [Streptomyces incarnatus]
MSTTYSVGYIVGSISSVSINRRLALALEKLAPEAGLVLHEIPIAELPFYNHDYEAPDADYPGAAAEYRDAVSRADGILIVTPEYNRSIPGVLKNALDWGEPAEGTSPAKRQAVLCGGCIHRRDRHRRRPTAPPFDPVVPRVPGTRPARGVPACEAGAH